MQTGNKTKLKFPVAVEKDDSPARYVSRIVPSIFFILVLVLITALWMVGCPVADDGSLFFGAVMCPGYVGQTARYARFHELGYVSLSQCFVGALLRRDVSY